MKFRRKARIPGLAGVAALIALLVAWAILTPSPIPELIFPSPESTWASIATLKWRLGFHSLATLVRVGIGWGLGITLGMLMGFWMSWSPRVRSVAHPLIEAVRPLPPLALIPFFIIWFGLGAAGQRLKGRKR